MNESLNHWFTWLIHSERWLPQKRSTAVCYSEKTTLLLWLYGFSLIFPTYLLIPT